MHLTLSSPEALGLLMSGRLCRTAGLSSGDFRTAAAVPGRRVVPDLRA